MGQPWLRTRDVAARVGLSDYAVRHIPPEQLPYLAVGGKAVRRYRLDDVEDYVDNHLVDDRESAARLAITRGPYRKR